MRMSQFRVLTALPRLCNNIPMKHDRLAREKLSALLQKHRTQDNTAKALRISQAHLSDLLNGRRTFSDAMLAKLGLKREIVEAK